MKLKILGIILLAVFLLAPLLVRAECTGTEAIETGLNLAESLLVLLGFGATGGAAVLIKSIVTGRKILAAVMQSLDDNELIDNLHLLTTAGNQGNAKAVKQFLTLAGGKADA